MRARRLVVLVSVSSSLLLVPAGLGAASGAESRAASRAAMKAARKPARFVTRCSFSHRLSDDPIVKFNQPGTSHSHDFFGNVSTNASSTLASLSEAGTTCINGKDRSGYWVPSLTVNGQRVRPRFANVYYQSVGKPNRAIKTIPRGLKVVAGDAMATTPQSLDIVSWNCGPDDDVALQTTPSRCSAPTLTMHVNFPDCWNGTTLDSADHKSHLAYHGRRGLCPAGYPVPIPRVRVNAHYPTTGGPGVALRRAGSSPVTPTSSTRGSRPSSAGSYGRASTRA